MEKKADFRTRVKNITGIRYRDIEIAGTEALFEGPIICKRGSVYIVGKAHCYNVTPEGHEEYHSFVRVIL